MAKCVECAVSIGFFSQHYTGNSIDGAKLEPCCQACADKTRTAYLEAQKARLSRRKSALNDESPQTPSNKESLGAASHENRTPVGASHNDGPMPRVVRAFLKAGIAGGIIAGLIGRWDANLRNEARYGAMLIEGYYPPLDVFEHSLSFAFKGALIFGLIAGVISYLMQTSRSTAPRA